MTTFVLINHAEDGTHTSVFKTAPAALKALADMLGRDHDWGAPIRINRTYVSDWGNRLVIEARPDGHTAAREEAIRNAYDARECGTVTKRQLALLERHGL